MKTLNSARALADAGLVDEARLPELERVAASYAVAVTEEMAALIDPAEPHGPIARQFLPSAAELETLPDERADPIGDGPHSPLRGIVHRYPDRVLLKLLHACPVYCRFCFRREMVGPGGDALTAAELDAAIAYVAGRPEIWEVILTGGDPLSLSDRRLADVVARLNAIPHVAVIRIHSRVPVVRPSRIGPGLIAALRGRAPVYVLLHCNHADELTAAARQAIATLVDGGIPMLGQSVLLRGVNDDIDSLTALMRALVAARVKPHYLHHGDLAPGTGHFRTAIADGQALMRGLRGRVSGLCHPTYMLDLPGGHGKVPLTPAYLQRTADGYVVEDWRGQAHDYRDSGPLAEGGGGEGT